ncbi:MAG: hypothetical protein DRH44_07470 [Candidatus Coatesbacteria bacterium]|nr:hypothetical protein [Candidatus Methanoxibalbensis ujae]RLC41389.1 MAG: hypothetical protein DRH44_07470 [Candidatus Coatesbacteria bacterium]RLC42929.1 MAG: hypothetical protein DRH49_02650 [Candidatus Coatesbacteria bacterium]
MAGYELVDVLNRVLQGLQDVLYYIADAIADNASIIATVVVLGGLTLLVWRYGSRMFRGMTAWFRGIF